jgi:hypothetical protein
MEARRKINFTPSTQKAWTNVQSMTLFCRPSYAVTIFSHCGELGCAQSNAPDCFAPWRAPIGALSKKVLMTHQHVRFLSLLIFSAFAGSAYCDWSASWSLSGDSELGAVHNFGPGPNPSSGLSPYVHSLIINKDRSGNADGEYVAGNVKVKGSVFMKASGKEFGIFASANVDDTTAGFGGGNTMQSQASLHLSDFMTCITDTNHHRIRMTSYWQIDGSLTSLVTGHYSATTPPEHLDYVDASANSNLQITGIGVGAGPYGGYLWGSSYHSINSNVTVDPNNYQKDPPKAIPITLVFENNVPELILLNVDAYATAVVNDQDILNGEGGMATAVLGLGDTFTWGGITSVTDADTGEPISDWTLTSTSGTDWATAATPEPSSLACAAVGMALIGFCRARRLATSGGLFE